jgi:hypothetical protein
VNGQGVFDMNKDTKQKQAKQPKPVACHAIRVENAPKGISHQKLDQDGQGITRIQN